MTWIVNVGKKINGKIDLRRFRTQEDAENFQKEWNLKLAESNTPDLADLQGVARHEVLAALGKLRAVGATLAQAVDFFLRFGRPPRGKATIQQAIEAFLEAKLRKKRSEKYQTTIRNTTLRPFSKAVGPDRQIGSITREQVEAFLHSKKNWSSRTIKTHHDYLATFFRWCLKEGYVLLNPVEGFEVPKITKENVTHWNPHEIWIQLEAALSSMKFKELAAMVLASFCGVRIEETERISWEQIDLKKRQLTMAGEQVKTSRRRFAEIPPAAIQWLKQIPEEGRRGKVATNSTIKNGLKRLRVNLEKHGWLTRRVQNGYRQAFAAYHYAVNHDAQYLSEIMSNSPTVIRSQYHELVTKEDGEIFFALFPKRTLVEGVAMALESDLFSMKGELEQSLRSFHNPVFAYVDSAQSAKVFDYDEIKNTLLRQDAERQRANKSGDEVDLENWPEAAEKPLAPHLAKGFYQVNRIREDYGFSPLESDVILLLRRVQDYLEESFGCDHDELVTSGNRPRESEGNHDQNPKSRQRATRTRPRSGARRKEQAGLRIGRK